RQGRGSSSAAQRHDVLLVCGRPRPRFRKATVPSTFSGAWPKGKEPSQGESRARQWQAWRQAPNAPVAAENQHSHSARHWETGQDGNRGPPIKPGRRHVSLGRSGQRTSHGSLGLFANLWGQSAVSSSIQAKSLLPRPYFAISTARRYWPDRPHLAHSIRTAPSLPTKSPNVIALWGLSTAKT